MKPDRIEVNPIAREQMDGTNRLIGAKFIFPDGQEISVFINSNAPDMITISGDDRIQVIPWATNMIRVKHA